VPLQGQGTDLKDKDKLPPNISGSSKHRRREKIAEGTGLSFNTLQKCQTIVESVRKNPELAPLLEKCNSGSSSNFGI
jgi:hypothetical protein